MNSSHPEPPDNPDPAVQPPPATDAAGNDQPTTTTDTATATSDTDGLAEYEWRSPCPLCWQALGCRTDGHVVQCILDLRQGRKLDDNYFTYMFSTLRYIPPADVAIQLVRERFLNRVDLLAFKPPWDMACCPCLPGDDLDRLITSHVYGFKAFGCKVHWRTSRKEGTTFRAGRWRLGTYSPALDGTSRWLCLDFDGGSKDEHSTPLADPLAVALTVQRRCERIGLLAYLERSGGGKGWHIWIFTRTPVAAAKLRYLGRLLVPTDALLADGSFADASSRGIEIFPKCDRIAAGGEAI